MYMDTKKMMKLVKQKNLKMKNRDQSCDHEKNCVNKK